MNRIEFEALKKEDDFLIIETDGAKIIFSTAENNKSYNRHNGEGTNNLNNLKEIFKKNKISYLKQVHSDKVYIYDGTNDIKDYEGDAIITKDEDSIIGVFTADCVPIILVDDDRKIVAAIHSGWRGTYDSITKNTVKKLVEEFGCREGSIKAFIGPHIRQCCYEVSEDLREKFLLKKKTHEDKLFKGRKLSLEECILQDLRESNIKEQNINSINLCTHCTSKVKLFSYRKSNGDYGRLFSFVFIKN